MHSSADHFNVIRARKNDFAIEFVANPFSPPPLSASQNTDQDRVADRRRPRGRKG